jgi:hypothetical protein
VSPRELRNLGGVRLTANSAQLSVRDLRMRPLRELPQPQIAPAQDSPLERAVLSYLADLPGRE